MKSLAALAVSACLFLSGCSNNVAITSAKIQLPNRIEKGDSIAATMEFAYNGATPEQGKAEELETQLQLTYSSSNPDVLKVDENGVLTALTPGSSEIRIVSENGKITDAKTINVVVSPTSIVMPEQINLDLLSNKQAKIQASVLPEDSTVNEIEYTSSDESVATVDNEGMILAVGQGETAIIAAIAEPTLQTECKVIVDAGLNSIQLSKEKTDMTVGQSLSLAVDSDPKDADLSGIEWYSSDELVAAVDDEGTVVAIGEGHCTVGIKLGALTNECAVTVSEKKIEQAKGPSVSSDSSAAESGQTSEPVVSQPKQDVAINTVYGAIPYELSASSGYWCYIDSSDSAYSAVAENINSMRTAAGVPTLTVDSSLSALATSRCSSFVAAGAMDHSGASTAEILASGPIYSASEACNGWRNSSGHYATLTSPSYSSMGIGCYFVSYGGSVYSYWCVTFA